jgi:tetratricopeptide (TPR) repeat protein
VRFSWQISAGEFFELMRPAAFALAAIVSAWVLAGARRLGFNLYIVAVWTLLTLFFPLIVFPLYLVARLYVRRREQTGENFNTPAEDSKAEDSKTADSKAAGSKAEDSAARPDGRENETPSSAPAKTLRSKYALPLLYLVTVLSLRGVAFYFDYRSVEAHLARANQARLMGRPERTIREYRAALALEDDAHTHYLLAVELSQTGQWEQALWEFRAAQRAGEPDDALPLGLAKALDALNRPAEAVLEYRRFLATRRCAAAAPDMQCEMARARLENE